jgi:hypothetical protein
MFEIKFKNIPENGSFAGKSFIFPTPDHSKGETKIDALETATEPCVVCNKPTIYTKDTHIDDRAYYEYGVGQLCPDCYHEIYTIKDKDGRYLGNT